MQYVLDIIFVVLVLIIAAVGYKKGFVKSLAGLVSKILAIILARIFSVQLAPVVYENYLKGFWQGKVEDAVFLNGDKSADSVDKVLSFIPNSLNGFLSAFGFDKQSIASSLTQQLSDKSADAAQVIMDNIVSPVCIFLLKIVLFVVLFFVAALLLKLVVFIIDKIFELPVLKGANRFFGLLFGLVEGVILIFIVCIIIEIAAGLINSDGFINIISQSKILGFVSGILKNVNLKNFGG